MNSLERNKQFSKLRYNYYVAGRALFFSGNSTEVGMYNLGHCIELTLKQALLEIVKLGKMRNSHETDKLFALAQKEGLFGDVEVSDDLIQYIQDFFWSRYPSQIQEQTEKMYDEGRGRGFSPTMILYYDDYILQLDQSMRKKFDNLEMSIAVKASQQIDSKDGRVFFHSNIPAISKLDEYIPDYKALMKTIFDKMDDRHKPINEKRFRSNLDILNSGYSSLWHGEGFTMSVGNFEEQKGFQFAKNYKNRSIVITDEKGLLMASSSFGDVMTIGKKV